MKVLSLSGSFRSRVDGSSRPRTATVSGDLHWGQDLNTNEIDGNVGHRSGQIGDVPCVQMMIQFSEPHNPGSFEPFD